jgi:hypothetical protein
VGQGEAYARTYVLKDPECIEEGLEFLGLEVGFPDGPELNSNEGAKRVVLADVLYRKGNRYYIVETKETVKLAAKGIREAEHNAECQDEHLKRAGEEAEIVPVFAAVDFPIQKPLIGAKVNHQ